MKELLEGLENIKDEAYYDDREVYVCWMDEEGDFGTTEEFDNYEDAQKECIENHFYSVEKQVYKDGERISEEEVWINPDYIPDYDYEDQEIEWVDEEFKREESNPFDEKLKEELDKIFSQDKMSENILSEDHIELEVGDVWQTVALPDYMETSVYEKVKDFWFSPNTEYVIEEIDGESDEDSRVILSYTNLDNPDVSFGTGVIEEFYEDVVAALKEGLQLGLIAVINGEALASKYSYDPDKAYDDGSEYIDAEEFDDDFNYDM